MDDPPDIDSKMQDLTVTSSENQPQQQPDTDEVSMDIDSEPLDPTSQASDNTDPTLLDQIPLPRTTEHAQTPHQAGASSIESLSYEEKLKWLEGVTKGHGVRAEDKLPFSDDEDEHQGSTDLVDKLTFDSDQGGRLLGQKLEDWCTQKGIGKLLQLSQLQVTSLLVENRQIQKHLEEFLKKLSDLGEVGRSSAFTAFLPTLLSERLPDFQRPSEEDQANWDVVDWWTWAIAQIHYELHVRSYGPLHNINAAPSALFAISYCFLRVARTFNKASTKAGTLAKLKAGKAAAANRSRQHRIQAATYNVFTSEAQHLRQGLEESGSASEPAQQTKGARKKPIYRPPKTSISASRSQPIPHTTQQTPVVDEHSSTPGTDYNKFSEDELAKSFAREQDAAHEQLMEENQERLDNDRRDLQECIEALKRNTIHYSMYRRAKQALLRSLHRFFSDFRHYKEEITDLHVKAVQAWGLDDTAVNEVLGGLRDTEGMSPEEISAHLQGLEVVKQLDAPTQLLLDVDPPSQDDINRLTNWNRLLNSSEFQPAYLRAACQQLEITNIAYKVMPNQNPKYRLRWWQVIEGKWAADQANGHVPGLRGGLIADDIGLGKTIEAAVNILQVSAIFGGHEKSFSSPPLVSIQHADIQ